MTLSGWWWASPIARSPTTRASNCCIIVGEILCCCGSGSLLLFPAPTFGGERVIRAYPLHIQFWERALLAPLPHSIVGDGLCFPLSPHSVVGEGLHSSPLPHSAVGEGRVRVLMRFKHTFDSLARCQTRNQTIAGGDSTMKSRSLQIHLAPGSSGHRFGRPPVRVLPAVPRLCKKRGWSRHRGSPDQSLFQFGGRRLVVPPDPGAAARTAHPPARFLERPDAARGRSRHHDSAAPALRSDG